MLDIMLFVFFVLEIIIGIIYYYDNREAMNLVNIIGWGFALILLIRIMIIK